MANQATKEPKNQRTSGSFILDAMSSKIVERIAAETGIPNLFSVLSRQLPASDLQSLLMHVYQARTAALGEADVLRGADRALLQASKIDARLLNEFDRVAFQVAEGFEAIELAPVCPLGLNRVLGAIDQNSVLTTIRNGEVLGDATMPMALECSRRRKDSTRRGDSTPVRLASSHRVVRLQPFDVPGYVPHFRLFSMVSAGRDTGSQTFEIQHLGEHIRFYLRLFRALGEHGFVLSNPLVEISDTVVIKALLSAHGISPEELRQSVRAHRLGGSEQFLAERGVTLPAASEDARLARLKTNLLDALQTEFPEAEFRFNLARLEGLSYYTGLCLRISPATSDGARFPVADGGFTNWTARLLQNKKERLLTSGIGTEFVCFRYRAS
jgi:transposase-like protein